MWEFNYNWVYQVHSDTGSLLIESTAIDEYGESNHDKHILVRGNHRALSHCNRSVEVNTLTLGLDRLAAKPLKKQCEYSATRVKWSDLNGRAVHSPASLQNPQLAYQKGGTLLASSSFKFNLA